MAPVKPAANLSSLHSLQVAISGERAQYRKNVSGHRRGDRWRRDTLSQEQTPLERDEAAAAFRANERSWNDEVIAEFRANHGEVAAPYNDPPPMLLLHTIGARSGKEHIVPMRGLPDDESSHRLMAALGSLTGTTTSSSIQTSPSRRGPKRIRCAPNCSMARSGMPSSRGMRPDFRFSLSTSASWLAPSQ
jgi:hypothetical protein